MTGEAKPYSKAQQLARGERRYRRKVASPKQWQAIIAAKGDACRFPPIVHDPAIVQYHHIVPRSLGGDDVADNIVPLCPNCHDAITYGTDPALTEEFLSLLTDAEYAYAVGKAGEDWAERIYGLRYSRV